MAAGKSSLTLNIVANYISQIYVTAIGILMVPFYLSYMGAEAYGLVGFFVMLQAWFSLLDMGLTPTMARESARFRGGALTAIDYRRLVRALQMLFLFIATFGGAALFVAAGAIARDWLKPDEMPLSQVEYALQLMAIGVAVRWMAGLYRGGVTGAERLVWLSNFSALVATLRFIGVLPVLILVDASPATFFQYQLAVAGFELVGLAAKNYRLLPPVPAEKPLGRSLAPLKSVLGFALTVAFTAAVGTVITQSDKLILSNVLPLAEYGYFSLAVLVAGGVIVIGTPVSGAIMPRMTRLVAEGDHCGLLGVYRSSTQIVAVIAGASSIALAFCAEPLLWAWTGDRTIAAYAAPLLALYALGNGIYAVGAFPYYLQYAKGNLRLHMYGSIGFALLILPAMIWAARQYGSIGPAVVWLSLNLISFCLWVPFVHARLEPGLNRKWYLEDVLVIYLAIGAAAVPLAVLMPHFESRLWQFGAILVLAFLLLCAGTAASSAARHKIGALFLRCASRKTALQ